MKKVFKDSLTNDDGQYSSKKLSMMLSFLCCVVMGMADQFTSHKVNIYVFESFLAMAGLLPALSMADRKLNPFASGSPVAETDQSQPSSIEQISSDDSEINLSK